MDAIALDPGDYGGTYKLVGGELSFDFVNTISWPGSADEHDWLDRPGNFILWSQAVGIIDNKMAKTLGQRPQSLLGKELRYVASVRSWLANALTPFAHNEKPTEAAIKKLEGLIHNIARYHRLDPLRLNWVWEEPHSFKEVLAPVIWNSGHVLTQIDHSRIRHCPSCDWLYFDSTKNRNRRWCDMGDCGSRDKALRYYHKQHKN
jgi:predicted RNA-binding Zn ribbon-like protein